MYSGAGSDTRVENEALVVSDCGGRSHDQSQNTPFHGEAYESYNKVAGPRSHTAAQCATESCGDYSRGKSGSILLSGRRSSRCPGLKIHSCRLTGKVLRESGSSPEIQPSAHSCTPIKLPPAYS